MALFRREQSAEAEPQGQPEAAPVSEPKTSKREVDDDLFLELFPEPPDTPRQRGAISEKRAAILRLQLKIADHLRQQLTPDLPLDMPWERTSEREQTVFRTLEQFASSGNLKIPSGLSKEKFYRSIMNEVFGFGPIQPLIDRDDITEIMVNSPYIVFVERDGRLAETGYKFLDDDHVVRIIKRIVLPLGRTAEYEHPLIDARLPDGSRVNAVIPPCAIDGPNITIRKFAKDKLMVEDLKRFGSLTDDIAYFLEAAVVSRLNIIVSGGTGSGKTTLINILSDYIPEHERTVTVEDAAELQLRQRNVVRLETKKPSPQSPSEVTIRDCVVNALRMRPERIVVGECRSGEALDMLQAMNTGHDGSMTTIHSNSPRDCISRLETLVLMAGVEMPMITIRQQIASAIDLIVQASRMRDGSRKVTQITEILGMEGENVVMQDLFLFYDEGDNQEGKVLGYHGSTGMRPHCDATLKRHGFELPASMFMKGSPR
ncbi:MAG TPA: CpaF family protein [Chloroflexi bacterium]|nr:CpaF family protein [Chloroflexota bacterium]